ncbi:MAG: radical SAM protein [Spirochaetales bacterium]|nr:radical SAM protein [Spirochaetales bacterium]
MSDVIELYENCKLCPKACGVNRLDGDTGFCGMSFNPSAASAVLHNGEEPPLVGEKGSGAVFFSGCTLGCPFCQNEQISSGKIGSELSEAKLVDIFLNLQKNGAANINLVTATQFTPSVISAVKSARNLGLSIPIMWNTSGYERPETIELLSDIIDIWLPDLKTLDSLVAGRLMNAPEYPDFAPAAIVQMVKSLEKNAGTLIENDIMKRGIIFRHLVMPGEMDSTRTVLKWFSENLKDNAMLSLMVQYTPVNEAGRQIAPDGYSMSDEEYNKLIDWLEEFDIEEGFLQEPEAASSDWIPDFKRQNPFPEKFSTPIWHWDDCVK